jgi:hypothetical protein
LFDFPTFSDIIALRLFLTVLPLIYFIGKEYISAMEEYYYNAFISYRHVQPDKAVAIKLQKLLETYKPPKNGHYKNTGRIKRIFRDESELPTSGDLGADIKKALSQSAYLIVICSTKTAESAWCLQEIEYFKQLHNGNNENIITLLVNGNPKEVFPKELCYETRISQLENGEQISNIIEVEPLAANIIDKDGQTSLRKLKTEFLRIVCCFAEYTIGRTPFTLFKFPFRLSSPMIRMFFRFSSGI